MGKEVDNSKNKKEKKTNGCWCDLKIIFIIDVNSLSEEKLKREN